MTACRACRAHAPDHDRGQDRYRAGHPDESKLYFSSREYRKPIFPMLGSNVPKLDEVWHRSVWVASVCHMNICVSLASGGTEVTYGTRSWRRGRRVKPGIRHAPHPTRAPARPTQRVHRWPDPRHRCSGRHAGPGSPPPCGHGRPALDPGKPDAANPLLTHH